MAWDSRRGTQNPKRSRCCIFSSSKESTENSLLQRFVIGERGSGGWSNHGRPRSAYMASEEENCWGFPSEEENCWGFPLPRGRGRSVIALLYNRSTIVIETFARCIFPFIGLAKTILQGTVKGGRRQGGQRKRWEDNIREWTGLEFGKSQRAVENREKWRKLVAKSSVVPQRPSRLRDWLWWWWRCICFLIVFRCSSAYEWFTLTHVCRNFLL